MRKTQLYIIYLYYWFSTLINGYCHMHRIIWKEIFKGIV